MSLWKKDNNMFFQINEWASCVLFENESAAIIFRLECTF